MIVEVLHDLVSPVHSREELTPVHSKRDGHNPVSVVWVPLGGHETLSPSLRAAHVVSIISSLYVLSFGDAFPKDSHFVESTAGEIVEATNIGIPYNLGSREPKPPS